MIGHPLGSYHQPVLEVEVTTPKTKPEGPPKEVKARVKRPGKQAVKKAITASLTGAMTEEDKATLEVAFTPTRRGLRTQKALRALADVDPWERDRAWISDALIQCPLPVSKPTGEEANKVVRKARTGNGELTVIYSATGEEGLAYGSDAYLLDLLISEGRKRGEQVVTFDTAIEILQLAGFDVGGHDYKRFNEALDRIGGLHIAILRRGAGKKNYRVVDIQNEDRPTKDDVRRELSGQKRVIKYAFRFSDEFYNDFMRFYSVFPRDILEAYGGAPTEYAIARWIYRRATKAQSAGYIPLEEVHQEIAPSDKRLRQFRAKFEKVLNGMQLDWPDLMEAWIPRRERKKGHDVFLGVQIRRPIPSLIGDRKAPVLANAVTD